MNGVNVTHYSEHTHDPKTWASPRPAFDMEKFNRELEKRGGLVNSVPRFRLRWAGEHDEYIIEEFDEFIGYSYKNADGETCFVSHTQGEFEFPDGALPVVEYENHKIRTPRFVIEEYRPAADPRNPSFYHQAWFIEELQKLDAYSGRVDWQSYYRAPAEIDLQMAEHLAQLRLALTPEAAKAGLERLKAVYEKAKQDRRHEFRKGIEEKTMKALTDGIPNAPAFSFKPQTTSIQEYSKQLIQEHDAKL